MNQASFFTQLQSVWQRIFFYKLFSKLSVGKTLVTGVPALWLCLFFFVPFLVVFGISFSEATIAIPPYLPIFNWDVDAALVNIRINFGNYLFLFQDPFYIEAYLSSLKIALVSTLLTLVVAFPIAYQIARTKGTMRLVLLMLVILPFWTSFLLRVYAWMEFLKKNGLVNEILLAMGVINEPLTMLQTDFAVYVGIVYTYLPFMVLPLYSALEKMDESLLEAAEDLGCRPMQRFFLITVPLAMPGIIAGCALVFIPAVGEFVIPALLGGADTLMIGRVLWDEFFLNRDWPMASAVACIMLIILVLPIMLVRNRQGKEEAN